VGIQTATKKLGKHHIQNTEKKRNQNKQSATGQQTASYTREKAHGENADKKGTMEFQQIYYSQYFSLCET